MRLLKPTDLRKVGRTLTSAALIALLELSGPRPSSAEEGGSSLALKHEYFWDRNGVWNHTPAFSLTWALSRKWSLHWEQEVDVVTGASRRLGMEKVGLTGDRDLDAVSGASKVEVRHSENPGIAYAHKGIVASASLYVSREDDYSSFSPAGSLSWDFNDRNTTVGISGAEFRDDYRPTGYFAGMGGRKRIRSLGATFAQSLTPFTLVGLTGSYISSSGYLGHPYNPPIDTSGSIMDESVPDRKQAGALAAQVVQGYLLGDRLGSVNMDVRRFQDTWGIASSTVDLKISQYFMEGAYLRLRGRFYNQTGAAFAKESYVGNETYRTADIRFFPFTSWLAGAKISAPFPDAWGESAMLPDRWDIKYDHIVRNTRGDPAGSNPQGAQRVLYQLYEPEEYYMQGVVMVGLLFNL
jgi:hypothetical protein